MARRWILLALAALAPLTLGCPATTAYMRATKPYAEAIAKGTTAIQGEFDTADLVCRRRAELDHALHLMEGSSAAIDWKGHCQELTDAAAMHRRALTLLGAYAAALDALGSGAAYDGAGQKQSVTAASELIKTFAREHGQTAAYVSALAEPLNQLSNFLLGQYATRELKRAIGDSAPSVQAILDGMRGYLATDAMQLKVYQHEVEHFIQSAEERLRGPEPGPAKGLRKVPPLEAMGFVCEASALRDEIDKALADQKARAAILDDLQKAQVALRHAGERDELELQTAVQSAIDALDRVRDLHELMEKE